MLSAPRNRSSRFGSLTQGRELQQFLERRLVPHHSAWVLGYYRRCPRRNCHRSCTRPHDPISYPLKRIERYRAKARLRSDRRRRLCPDYRKRDTVRRRPRVHQLQTAREHLLWNPGLVPCPIGFGDAELLPGLVQIVQSRQHSTEPATRGPPLIARTCSSKHELERAMEKPRWD